MSDGPNPSAKWSKYSVEDGNLVRKVNSVLPVVLVFSLLYTLIASHAVAVDILRKSSDSQLSFPCDG